MIVQRVGNSAGPGRTLLPQMEENQRSGSSESIPSVKEVLEAYRDQRGPEVRSPDAIKYAVAALIPRLGGLRPMGLTPIVIKTYARERGAKDGTILREIGTLRAALSWALEHQLISAAQKPIISNPVKTPPPREKWITKDQARCLIAACQEPHIRLFVTLGLMTVARMSAILEAKWTQINWEHRLIDYGPGHGNKRRAVVPLNQEVFSLLEGAKKMAATEWIIEYHGKPVETIKNGFAGACKRAGLTDVTPHILRHSGATWMALEGVPMREIARMLGDREETTERVYAKYHPAHLKRAASALELSGTELDR